MTPWNVAESKLWLEWVSYLWRCNAQSCGDHDLLSQTLEAPAQGYILT